MPSRKLTLHIWGPGGGAGGLDGAGGVNERSREKPAEQVEMAES